MARSARKPTDTELAFGHELRKAIRARDVTQRSIAQALGMQPNRLCDYMAGRVIPMMDRVIRLADVLMWPKLVTIAQSATVRVCELCGIDYYDAGQQRKSRWCGQSCRQTHHSRRMRGNSQVNERLARRRVARYAAAVTAFCGDCTAGEGLCRDDQCHLRAVSPLPFVPINGMKKGAA